MAKAKPKKRWKHQRFRDFYLPMDSLAREDFARRCDTTAKQLLNIANDRVCSPELAINIERESKREVRVEDMAPTAKGMPVDWDYIRTSGCRTSRVGA